jgi:hypothetical protein
MWLCSMPTDEYLVISISKLRIEIDDSAKYDAEHGRNCTSIFSISTNEKLMLLGRKTAEIVDPHL